MGQVEILVPGCGVPKKINEMKRRRRRRRRRFCCRYGPPLVPPSTPDVRTRVNSGNKHLTTYDAKYAPHYHRPWPPPQTHLNYENQSVPTRPAPGCGVPKKINEMKRRRHRRRR